MRKIIGFRTLCVGLGIWVGTVGVSAQGEFKALPWSQSTAYNSYLMRDVHRQFADRQSAIQQAFASPAGMQEYLEGCRERYKQIVGTFPEKGNLNAQVVGKVQGTGYHIEKIIFESKPGRYVTAHLYMPENTTVPVPATLELCGHGLNGKGSSSHAAMLMASNGIAVLVVDPIGQGERLQLIDREGKPLTRGATTEHTLLNAGFNLLGTSLAAQEYWDNHRALDYLLTRKDIDPEHIGVYGSSGGGTQTAYYIGLDPRVKVAAICSFFSTRERTMELQGPSDGCQHIPYEGREQLEVPDFALMMAPRPLLILSGKYDFVDLWGAQQGFAELQQCYKVLGVPEKVDMLTVETGHGLGTEKRQKLVSWFKRWLKDDQSPVKKSAQDRFRLSDMLCTTKGQVNVSMPGALSIMQENVNQLDEWASKREAFLSKGKKTVQAKMLDLLGLKGLPDHKIRIEATGHDSMREYEQYKFQLIREGEMPVPCILIIPSRANADSPVELRLQEEGKGTYLSEYANFAAALTEGKILLLADLRGLGETTDPAFYTDAKYWNREYRNAMISMHIGRPIMGQRVVDILTLLDFCSEHEFLKGHSVKVFANGIYGPAAIHAAYLDERINSVEITHSVKTWKEYIERPMQWDMYSNVLYGALKYYDLPDLIRLSNCPIRFAD